MYVTISLQRGRQRGARLAPGALAAATTAANAATTTTLPPLLQLPAFCIRTISHNELTASWLGRTAKAFFFLGMAVAEEAAAAAAAAAAMTFLWCVDVLSLYPSIGELKSASRSSSFSKATRFSAT